MTGPTPPPPTYRSVVGLENGVTLDAGPFTDSEAAMSFLKQMVDFCNRKGLLVVSAKIHAPNPGVELNPR